MIFRPNKRAVIWLSRVECTKHTSFDYVPLIGGVFISYFWNAQNAKKKRTEYDSICWVAFRRPSLFTALPIRLRLYDNLLSIISTFSVCFLYGLMYAVWWRSAVLGQNYDTFSIRLLRSFTRYQDYQFLLDKSRDHLTRDTECSHGNYQVVQ